MCPHLSHDAGVHQVFHGGEALLQPEADGAQGDAVGQGDVPVQCTLQGEKCSAVCNVQ